MLDPDVTWRTYSPHGVSVKLALVDPRRLAAMDVPSIDPDPIDPD